jgi:hypothetical protein
VSELQVVGRDLRGLRGRRGYGFTQWGGVDMKPARLERRVGDCATQSSDAAARRDRVAPWLGCVARRCRVASASCRRWLHGWRFRWGDGEC